MFRPTPTVQWMANVLGTAWAGKPLDVEVNPGQAVRIMTGGMMPPGTDTVVIQEHVSATGNSVTIDGSTTISV